MAALGNDHRSKQLLRYDGHSRKPGNDKRPKQNRWWRRKVKRGLKETAENMNQ